MLFEAACFDGTNIRLSGRKIGLRTDASAKFEKGLDPNTAIEAMNRACQLIEELGAGEVVGGVVDVYPNAKGDKRIPFEPEKYNKLLGTDIAKETMLAYFSKINLGYDPASNEVIVPSWRDVYKRQAYMQLMRADLAAYGAHINDSTSYQVYNKVEKTKESVAAVDATCGQVLTWNGKVVEAYYFSTSMGYTDTCLLYTSRCV